MKDLVRGTIYSDLHRVIDAYIFFKDTPGVEVVGIKQKIALLNNITVNFVYGRRFIGEIQFHYLDQTERQKRKYHGNHFIYELERAQEVVEIISALNKKAVYLSEHHQFVKPTPRELRPPKRP